MNNTMIKTVALRKYFDTAKGKLHAVDGVDLELAKGKTLGVVGESGCGKTTLGRLILRLVPATSGEVYFEGENLLSLSRHEMHEKRKEMQMIFQDPYSSLNPRMCVSDIIGESLKVNGLLKGKREISCRVGELMDTVGLARRLAYSYPHELDGGRRQRIGIARALAVKPKFIVCDEPVSSLDVSIQAQIINLLVELQKELKLSYLFISHDLSVVKYISDDIIVMYLGECVEQGPAKLLFKNPLHPYTKALLQAIPIPDLKYRTQKRDILSGEVTSPINPQPGCRFFSRCLHACQDCAKEVPMFEINDEHKVRCIMYRKG